MRECRWLQRFKPTRQPERQEGMGNVHEYFGYFADVKRNAMMYREANIVSNMRIDFRLT